MSAGERAELYAWLAREMRAELYRRWPALRDIDQARAAEEGIRAEHRARPARDFRRRPPSSFWRRM